MRESVNP